MERRAFVAVTAASLLVAPLTSIGQQSGKMFRIGFLGAASATGYATRVEAFRAGLRDLGYVEGENISIEFRWAEGRYDLLPELAMELVRLNPDVIVTHAIPPTVAAKRATTTIPIVMTNVGDAVSLGIVTNLARPGGNITGDTFFIPELAAKRLEILKDVVPTVRRVAVLVNPENPLIALALQTMAAPAKLLGLSLRQFDARESGELENAFVAMSNERVDALAVIEDAKFIVNWKKIADLATKHRLPSISFPEFASAGGLIGYGADHLVLYRRAAVFVDKILRGAKPADIPVERPTKFVLAFNLKTANTLGLTIPTTMLLRADELIR